MATNKLTEAAVRNAKPRSIEEAEKKKKSFKLADGEGLYLLVTPKGGKHWRLKFRYHGKEQVLALGSYPAVSIASARRARQIAKEALAAGQNPAREKQLKKRREKLSADNTFGGVAKEYFEKCRVEGLAESTVEKLEWVFGRLSDSLRRSPIAAIRPPDLRDDLRRIEKKGRHETAKRCLQLSGRIFRFAVASALIDSDPSRDLKDALAKPKPKSFAAIVEPERVGALLRAIDAYEGSATVKIAMQLAPHVYLRPGELRSARWPEVDLDDAKWVIPAPRTKMRRPHTVYLSRQAVELLQLARDINGEGEFVFPSARSVKRPMSENAITAALRRMGYSGEEHTGHGWRSTFSTIANESDKWSRDLIEISLAHGDEDKVRGIYNRAEYRTKRAELAQWYSDQLDLFRRGGAEIVALPAKQA